MSQPSNEFLIEPPHVAIQRNEVLDGSQHVADAVLGGLGSMIVAGEVTEV